MKECNENLLIKYYELCRSIDFPQTQLNDVTLHKNYNTLCNKDLNRLSNCCSQLLQHFHPSIWSCNVKNKLSPLQGWNDNLILVKTIKNRLKYKGEKLSPKDIRAGLYISKLCPKVSIFSPSLAKYLMKKYLNEFNLIFDPCSGFSGRLLGACSLDKRYIGQDINPITVSESKNIISYFNLNAEITCCNSITKRGEYDCLFTCPPYSDKENWNQDIENLSCDEWISIFLNNYKCKKYLFVVDKTEKYKDYVIEEIENKSYLTNTVKEYIILI